MSIETTSCCGIRDWNGIQGRRAPAPVVKEMVSELLEQPGAFMIFSNTTRKDDPKTNIGHRVAAYIEAQGLGTVTASKPRYNPNSGHYIVIWVWTIRRKAMAEWVKVNNIRAPYSSRW